MYKLNIGTTFSPKLIPTIDVDYGITKVNH